MSSTTTATQQTDTIINGINILSLDHDYNKNSQYHHHHHHQDYYSDDTTSEITVTATKETINHESSDKTPVTNNNDWLDEIENSFDTNSDFYDHHLIIQSYLEPTCIVHHSTLSPPHPVVPTSKFSAIKSRVKRVFRFSTIDNKQQILMQSSLPVFPTTNQKRWNTSSIDSLCSSTTTAAASTSSNVSTCSIKNYNRHSCGISTASFTNSHKRHSQKTFLPIDTTTVTNKKDVKGILKKRQSSSFVPQPPQPRPTSVIDYNQHNKKKRWSTRLSISAYNNNNNNNKRYTLSSMMKRKKSTELFTTTKSSTISAGIGGSGVKFNKYVNVHETYSKGEYDRSSDPEAVCTRLTSNLAQQIKQELNHFKLHEMSVHDSSRIHTHFFL